jgi:hypothetical protein
MAVQGVPTELGTEKISKLSDLSNNIKLSATEN